MPHLFKLFDKKKRHLINLFQSPDQSYHESSASASATAASAVGVLLLPPTTIIASTGTMSRREVEMKVQSQYRDDPTGDENHHHDDHQDDNHDHEEEEEEEEYSFLPTTNNSGRNNPSSLSNDIATCTSAYSRLSTPSRSLLLSIVCALFVYGTYQFGIQEGAREQRTNRTPSGGSNGRSFLDEWRMFRGENKRVGDNESGPGLGANPTNNNDETQRQSPASPPSSSSSPPASAAHSGRDFTKDHLHATRDAARELIDLLDDYYGGKDKARNMLARSWQAGWELDLDQYLEDGVDVDSIDIDVDDVVVDDVGDADDDTDDSAGNDDDADDDDDSNNDDSNNNNDDDSDNSNNDDKKSNKRHKRKKNKNKNKNNKNRNLGKKKKKVKRAKIIHNHPSNLTPQQLKLQSIYHKQRTTKLISTMARALLNPHQQNFMIGTIGSSVAAGHDNCNYDSYENQLERTLTSIFHAADMKLIVQNAGEGGGCGDSHENQVYCIMHNVSPNVDIIHYSWTYFEKGGAESARESLIRWGQRMRRRPMVHHLVARGKADTCDGDDLANAMLDNTYAIYGYNAFCIQTGLYFGGHDYDAEQEAGINRFGWQHVGDGYHNTTRYGELEEDDERKDSLGTVYRNWHPGPLGFQIAADAFSYVYGMGVLMALELIERDMDAGVDVHDRWFVKTVVPEGRDLEDATIMEENHDNANSLRRLRHPTRQHQHQHQEHEQEQGQQQQLEQHRQLETKLSLPPLPVNDMPEPLFCHPLYCSIPYPPSCLNYERPTFGTPGPVVRTQSNWTIWHEDNKWNYMVGKYDTALFKRWHDEEWYQKCAHADACGGITASNADKGELVFELPASTMVTGLIIVCGCCGKNVGENMFLNNDNVVIKLNDRVVDKTKMDVFPNAKCVRVLKSFQEFDEGGEFSKEDEMLLSFELLEDGEEVKISHLIAL